MVSINVSFHRVMDSEAHRESALPLPITHTTACGVSRVPTRLSVYMISIPTLDRVRWRERGCEWTERPSTPKHQTGEVAEEHM